jgi:hypothetical protein
VRRALTSEHGHLSIAVHPHRVVTGCERIDAVQVIALHPILKFAGLVAGVRANFKHGHDDYLHGNRMRLGVGHS